MKRVIEIYQYLKDYISESIPIGKDPDRQLMMDGILLSIINDRYIHLTGLSSTKCDMQDRICRMVIANFPKYMYDIKKIPTPYLQSINKFMGGLKIKAK